ACGEHLALRRERSRVHAAVPDLGASQALGHDLEKLPALPWCQRCRQLTECCNLCIGESDQDATTHRRGGCRHHRSWSRHASLSRNESQSARLVRGSSGPPSSLCSSGLMSSGPSPSSRPSSRFVH